jgi:hypothetical protein
MCNQQCLYAKQAIEGTSAPFGNPPAIAQVLYFPSSERWLVTGLTYLDCESQ